MIKPRIKLFGSTFTTEPFMKWACRARGTTSGYGITPKSAYMSWKFNNPPAYLWKQQ